MAYTVSSNEAFNRSGFTGYATAPENQTRFADSKTASVMEIDPLGDYDYPLDGKQLIDMNPYRPWPARITSITELTATGKLFEFRFIDERVRQALDRKTHV